MFSPDLKQFKAVKNDGISGRLYGGALEALAVDGPKESWCSPEGSAMFGKGCVRLTGKHENAGRYLASAVLFDGINETVNKNTVFSYRIFPDYHGEEYDYELSGQYAAVDIMFSDGTFLSDSGVKDVNGHPLCAISQGLTRSLYTRQWNEISVRLSDFAGKTAAAVVARYDKPSKKQGEPTDILFYLDGISLCDRTPAVYRSNADYILTTRGTNDTLTFSRGLCMPSVCTPHPFNFYSPSTTAGGRSVYDYCGTKITHFIVSHQASYHLTDIGCFMFMPNTSVALPDERNCAANERAAEFDHSDESAGAHLYTVKFKNGSAASGVEALLAPASHSVIAEFNFPADAENVNVILDCVCEYCDDKSRIVFGEDGSFFAESEYLFRPLGIPFEKMYYYGVFSTVPVNTSVLCDERSFGCASFKKGTKKVVLRLASSYISAEQAKANLSLEVSSDDTVKSVSARAKAEWNKYLGLFDIEGATEEQRISFYSNLYRMFAYPTTLSENVGTAKKPHYVYLSPYSLREGKKEIKDGIIYTSNGFWDTYRTTWAAYALISPEHDTELLEGILQHYRDCGWIGRWLYPGAINCMVGTNSDVIFADAAAKGIKFNKTDAYNAALKNASVYSPDTTYGRKCPNISQYLGFTPDDVCWTLENAIDDYGVSVLAKALKKQDEYEYFASCAERYRNVFSDEADFFVGRDKDGKFMTDTTRFDPYKWGDSYCETNGWGTAFTVQHDVAGMAKLYGGRAAFTRKVCGMFEAETKYNAAWFQHEMFEAREIRLGQYQHSNQPAHHNIYMFNYTDKPYLTQKYTRDILDRLFVGNKFGQGYVGDDDNGEQSAWYVLSAMGFYPLNMGSGQYAVTSPLFKKLTLHRSAGDIEISARNQSPENVYIKSMTVDGKAYDSLFIDHKTLVKAKKIVFEMSPVPTPFGVSGKPGAALSADNKSAFMCADMAKEPSVKSVTGLGNKSFKALFDNDSLTVCTVPDGNMSVTIESESEKPLRFVTLTSGENISAAPESLEVYGSPDGMMNTFEKLTSREGIVFEWPHQLKPFAVHNEKAFKYYRLDIRGKKNTEIAEIELLG